MLTERLGQIFNNILNDRIRRVYAYYKQSLNHGF